MGLKLGQLRVGKVDGKHEYLTPVTERERDPFNAFLIPETVEPDRLRNSDVFFIEGFRGTGKTSLLRWHAEAKRMQGAKTDFVLFKTDLNESQRLHISKEVGISWSDIDAKSMEVAQDFKAAWTWFIQHKIGETLKSSPLIIDHDSKAVSEKIVRLLGLHDEGIFQKAIGFMPRLEGANIKIKADIAFFEAELGGDFKSQEKSKDVGSTTLEAISRRISILSKSLKLKSPLYIYFDELEAFYHTPEQHKRDQRMVRDLLFSVSSLNDAFRESNLDIHILAAVRSEVIDSMGSLGQEVDRLVHDRGFTISWHHAKRSMNHPLIQIIKNKIQSSELSAGMPISSDPMGSYFPKNVNSETIDAFILDKSFYKPRDIVWRLSIAQKLFPSETFFSIEILRETETEYSSKLWEEVRYELSATYSDDEINCIESVLSGGNTAFDMVEMERRFRQAENHSIIAQSLLSRRSVQEIMEDLYRLGAIGNSFRGGPAGSDQRNRWAFRGETNLLVEKRMVIHQALFKRLSAVPTRRRGSTGAGRSR
jgi:hypothetical protein